MSREWRNWQTRTFEGRVVYPYGFKSRLSHQKEKGCIASLFLLILRARGETDLGTASVFALKSTSGAFLRDISRTEKKGASGESSPFLALIRHLLVVDLYTYCKAS